MNLTCVHFKKVMHSSAGEQNGITTVMTRWQGASLSKALTTTTTAIVNTEKTKWEEVRKQPQNPMGASWLCNNWLGDTRTCYNSNKWQSGTADWLEWLVEVSWTVANGWPQRLMLRVWHAAGSKQHYTAIIWHVAAEWQSRCVADDVVVVTYKELLLFFCSCSAAHLVETVAEVVVAQSLHVARLHCLPHIW